MNFAYMYIVQCTVQSHTPYSTINNNGCVLSGPDMQSRVLTHIIDVCVCAVVYMQDTRYIVPFVVASFIPGSFMFFLCLSLTYNVIIVRSSTLLLHLSFTLSPSSPRAPGIDTSPAIFGV